MDHVDMELLFWNADMAQLPPPKTQRF